MRTAAINRARDLAVPILASLNDEERDPTTRAEAQSRRGILPIRGFQRPPEADVDEANGNATARQLIERWDSALVKRLLEEIEVKGAAYWLRGDDDVELEPRLLTGPASALVALHLAHARKLLRSIESGSDPFKRRLKQCVNPTCRKWFFDAERGTRKWCCIACGNAHRQLKLDRDGYLRRLKAGDYQKRRAPCSREGCEG